MATSNFMSIFNSIEKFDGKGDLSSWLTRFNRCCSVAQKDDDVAKGQIILLCLKGQALAVAEQLETEREGGQTYPQVVHRLETVFNTTASRERKMLEFEKRTQKAQETEEEYMLSLVQLYKSANPHVTNQEFQRAVKRKFLQGIPPELRRAIYVFCNDPHAIIVSYQRLLEYTRTAKLNIIESNSHANDTSTVCSVNADVTQSNSNTASTTNNELLQAITNLTVSLNDHVNFFTAGQSNSQRNRNSYQSQNSRGRGRGSFFGRGRGYGGGNPRQFGNSTQSNPKRCWKCNGENHIARFCTKN